MQKCTVYSGQILLFKINQDQNLQFLASLMIQTIILSKVFCDYISLYIDELVFMPKLVAITPKTILKDS